jgi:hypothetical protein
MKIRSVETEWFHAEGRTNRCDEVNNRISQFCKLAKKKKIAAKAVSFLARIGTLHISVIANCNN